MNGLQVLEVSEVLRLKGGYIFNTPEFQSLKSGEKKYFVLLEDKQPIARLCFHLENTKAFSGYQATFGSIDSEYSLTKDAIRYFLEQVIKVLRNEKIGEIIIKHWPAAYKGGASFHEVVVELGFLLICSEVNQHLVVIQGDFYQIVKKKQHSKLNQSRDKGYTFKALNINELPNVYRLVQKTLTRKGYSASMTYDDLFRTIRSIPDKYLLFGLFDKDKLISASVSIRISQGILYNFYHADDFNYRSTSPMVMLIQGIYRYCQQNGIRILDLGVSSENGLINQGLFNFKKNLGCESSEKNTYRLSYD